MSEGEKGISAPTPAKPVTATQEPKTESVAEVLREKAPDILEALPPDKRAELAGISIEKHEFSMRSSPLPDPAELAAYNQIIPAGADRILKMAEAQLAHRIKNRIHGC